MAIPYTRLQLIQRIRRHANNGFISDSYSVSDNELCLYIDQAVAAQIPQLAYAGAKIEGALVINEAFLVTYQLVLNQDPVSGYWNTTLPQPPLSLPLGFSITRAYFASTGNGVGQDIFPIKAKRVSYRNNLPMPTGTRYWVENSTMWVAASNNQPLLNRVLYVQMPTARVTDLNAPMNMPDDIIEVVFNDVIVQLARRNQEPRDILADGLPAGNNSLKS